MIGYLPPRQHICPHCLTDRSRGPTFRLCPPALRTVVDRERLLSLVGTPLRICTTIRSRMIACHHVSASISRSRDQVGNLQHADAEVHVVILLAIDRSGMIFNRPTARS